MQGTTTLTYIFIHAGHKKKNKHKIGKNLKTLMTSLKRT